MAEIRPPARPAFPPPASTRPTEPASASAAQRAFFQAALGKAQAPAAPAPAPRTTTVATPAATPLRAERVVAPTAEAPTRYLRPGSLLDIKV